LNSNPVESLVRSSFPSELDMKRDLHNLKLGFIQQIRNVHFDSTDHNCPKESPRSEWAPKSRKIPRRVTNPHAEVSIPRTEFAAHAYQLITRKLSVRGESWVRCSEVVASQDRV